MMNKQNTLITALATDQPQILAALAKKWGIDMPFTEWGHRNYWGLVVLLAQHVEQPASAWHNDLYDTREDVRREVNELFFDEGVGDG